MSRSPGEIRAALAAVPVAHGPCTLRELLERSQVGYDAARYTVQNMVRAGALIKVGSERRAHAKRWVALYDVPPTTEGEEPTPSQASDVQVHDGFVILHGAVAAWR